MRSCFALALWFFSYALSPAAPAFELPFDAYRHQVWWKGMVDGNGPVWILFDSAAGGCTISRELMERFGLANRQFAIGTAGGAGPERLTVPVLRGVTLSYRGLSLQPAQLPAVPHDIVNEAMGRRIDAIVGKDLLQRYVVELDNSARKVVLHEPAGFHYTGKGFVAPVRIADGPILDAAIRVPGKGKLACRLLVDSGAAQALTFTSPYSRTQGLQEAARSLSQRQLATIGVGVGGEDGVVIGRVESLEIGPYSIALPVARFSAARGGSLARTDFDALIGMEVLRRFRVIFDYPRSRMILEPNASLGEPCEGDMSGLLLRASGPSMEELAVARVLADTPAAKAGLQPGDRILALEGRKPESLWDVQLLLRSQPGRKIKLAIARGMRQLVVELILERLT
jgi:hypothetical protein